MKKVLILVMAVAALAMHPAEAGSMFCSTFNGYCLVDTTAAGLVVSKVKVAFGIDGSFTDVSSVNPLPVAVISGGGSGGGTVVLQGARDATVSPWYVTGPSGVNLAQETGGQLQTAATAVQSLDSKIYAANTQGSFARNTSITTTASTFTAPANAVGFILLAESTNTDKIRWAIGSTASTTTGVLFEAGRDSGYIPGGANISVASVSGTQTVSVQWILSH